MEDKFSVIIIDDDDGIIDSITAHISDKYLVDGYTKSREGIESIRINEYDLLILDYFIDELNAQSIVKKIREVDENLYIMLLTGRVDEIPAMDTLEKLDVQMYCEKTAHFEKILVNIESAIKSIHHSRKAGSFGLRLKKLRTNNNLSQEELSKKLGIGRTTIANWETNQAEPTSENIKKLADIFKVTTDYLLGYKPNF